MLDQVLPEAEVRALETVDVYIATIEPKHTNQVIKFIRGKLPATQGLDHIKQIRKTTTDDGAVKLDVVLCEGLALSAQVLDQLLKQEGLESMVTPRIHGVPKYPPLTRDQFEQWKAAWPTTFREDTNRHPKISDKDEAAIMGHIQSVWGHTAEATSKGELPIAAMIVDPLTQQIMATSYDTRKSTGYILQHAVMNCVAAVAKRERDGSLSQRAEYHHQQPHSIGSDTVVPISSEKQGAEPVTGRESTPSPICGEKRKKNPVSETNLSTPSPESSASPLLRDEGAGDTEDRRVKKAYLCTGYDVFLTHEPCVMCSMALVHSRVGRVFYTVPMAASGGLGSQHKIHSHPSLNHHFFVYRQVGYQAQQDKVKEQCGDDSMNENKGASIGLLALENQKVDC
ncbi:adenosine deaminase, tRNA-specific 3 [Mortierella hygrophila]|uniref:Adenosine deaminase, tRNA-specific 3 n=1 Tax=Mortierella hygrophila TaxID=979708 RepID=A0A9P6EZA5_9FUNG|nr:adenosine deaminase, tRNA-specific 3 [Mortierella hygrophila]